MKTKFWLVAAVLAATTAGAEEKFPADRADFADNTDRGNAATLRATSLPTKQKSAGDTFAADVAYLKKKFRSDVTDRSTGKNLDELVTGVRKLYAENKDREPWQIGKARLFAWVADNMAIDVSPHDWFPAIACWNRHRRPLSGVLGDRNRVIDAKYCPEVTRRVNEGNASGRWTMWKDFDHSVPDWDRILALGFTGMKAELKKYWRDEPYYHGCEITIDAILRGIDRFIAQGEKRLGEIEGEGENVETLRATSLRRADERLKKEIAALRACREGAPKTVYEVMMFTWLYFFYSEHIDNMQVRSLGCLDRLWAPYYRADLAAGRTTEAEFREQFRHFLWQWGSINNYWGQPAYLGGTKADGSTEYSDFSLLLLDVIDETALPTPKFQVKIAPNTPDAVWNKLLAMVRRHRSLVFCGEAGMSRALKSLGFTDEECRTMVVKGCYEFAPPQCANDTAIGHVNLLKPVEVLLKRAKERKLAPADLADNADGGKCRDVARNVSTVGTPVETRLIASLPTQQKSASSAESAGDIKTWSAFLAAYERELTAAVDACRDYGYEWEKHLAAINPAAVFSLSLDYSVRTGKDAFFNGTARGNNTSILMVGLGTTVDALLAVKELCFEKQELTLAQLGEILAKNWAGHETLRLRMLRSKRKWGNNDAEANALGARLSGVVASRVNGHPNSRGGKFMLSGHCAKQFVVQGERTGATPDGRKAKEEMSKNLSPTMGADTEGVTALVETLAALKPEDMPADYPLDVMLHPSAVAGEKGLAAMRALIERYMENGGCAVHFNVFSVEELRDAQAHPERYENLQVRVCGWNVRWNDLPRKEQDAYIRRAESMNF